MKKVLSMTLCLLLALGLFAGCGGGNDTPSSSGAAPEPAASGEAAEPAGESAESAARDINGLALPLSTTGEELTVWTLFENTFVPDPANLPGVQKMEEITGVHINWIPIGLAEIQEKFGTMLVSGDLPDVIYAPNTVLPGGVDKAVTDGLFLDMTDLVAQHMPNYRKMLEDPAYNRAAMTDSGRYASIFSFAGSDTEITPEQEWIGLALRKDLLDQYQLELPETMDDWHAVLTAGKESGMTAPLIIGPYGVATLNDGFVSAYGILQEYYLDGGAVKYGAVQPQYKEYLDTMRQWFSEGLIDPDFLGAAMMLGPDAVNLATNASVGFSILWNLTADAYLTMGVAQNEDFWIGAVPNPVLSSGDKPVYKAVSASALGNPVYVSANTENPELVAKWLDYQMTEEAMLFNFYGVEGESYTVADDGTYQFTDAVMQSPDGATPTDALKHYARGNGLGRYNWQYLEKLSPNSAPLVAAKETWSNQENISLPLYMSMTDEEGNAYASKYTAIQTRVREYTVSYIMGAVPDDGFDAFVAEIESFGLADCLAIQQDVYDRFINRA